MSKHPREELTFLMVKPDGVRRGLLGEIISRVERAGLKVVGLKMIKPTRREINNHYPKSKTWVHRLGEKTLATYAKFGFDAQKELGTDNPKKIGPMVRRWLVDFMSSAPLVAVAVKGIHAITMIRKMAGPTMPSDAPLGTIRGDFSVDSAAAANRDRRAVYNIVHVSETEEEARHEIKHWFGEAEPIHDYSRTDDEVFPK